MTHVERRMLSFNDLMRRLNMIHRGDRVEILPEFRDDGDDTFIWIAVSDEEKGRVDISPVMTELSIPPVQTVRCDWVRKL